MDFLDGGNGSSGRHIYIYIYIYIHIMLDFCSVLITLPKMFFIYICDGIGKKLVWKERMAQESWSR